MAESLLLAACWGIGVAVCCVLCAVPLACCPSRSACLLLRYLLLTIPTALSQPTWSHCRNSPSICPCHSQIWPALIRKVSSYHRRTSLETVWGGGESNVSLMYMSGKITQEYMKSVINVFFIFYDNYPNIHSNHLILNHLILRPSNRYRTSNRYEAYRNQYLLYSLL
jgi:hypothetical protein